MGHRLTRMKRIGSFSICHLKKGVTIYELTRNGTKKKRGKWPQINAGEKDRIIFHLSFEEGRYDPRIHTKRHERERGNGPQINADEKDSERE